MDARGGAQFVRDVDDEVLADALEPLQILLFVFQLADDALQPFTRLIELFRKQAQFLTTSGGDAHLKIAARKLAGLIDDARKAARG